MINLENGGVNVVTTIQHASTLNGFESCLHASGMKHLVDHHVLSMSILI